MHVHSFNNEYSTVLRTRTCTEVNFFAVDNPDLFMCELKSSEGLSYLSFHACLVELFVAILRRKRITDERWEVVGASLVVKLEQIW